MSDIQFINGLIVKAPNPKAPDFVKASLSIKREELIAWLQAQQGEWINADVKVSRNGKWYCAVNEWKPKDDRQPARTSAPAEGFEDDDIPF